MKKLLGLSLLVGLLFLSGCAITHEYGPYMGKVVEKETGEPIEGAVVFMKFYSRLPTPGGPVGYYADAAETLTDEQGEFVIPSQRIWAFRPLSSWDQQPSIIIFKPVYGAFPRHPDTTISPEKATLGKPSQQIVVKLPKLHSKEERLRNLGYASLDDALKIPCEKQRVYLKLYNLENSDLGLSPIMTNVCGGNRFEN